MTREEPKKKLFAAGSAEEIAELTPDEIEKVSGGYVYDGDLTWLLGHEITCPYCGEGSEEVVQFVTTVNQSRTNACFQCKACRKQFNFAYTYGMLMEFDDHGNLIKKTRAK